MKDQTNATARENFDLKASRSDTEDGKPSREMSCGLKKVATINNTNITIMNSETRQSRRNFEYNRINLYIIGQLTKYYYTKNTSTRRIEIT